MTAPTNHPSTLRTELGPDGFLVLDQGVAKGMRKWLADTAKTLIKPIRVVENPHEGTVYLRQVKGEDGEELFTKADRKDIQLVERTGILLYKLSRYGEAEPLLRLAFNWYDFAPQADT